MPNTTVDPKTLQPAAATHYEARAFQEKNPDFFICKQNATVMLEYMTQRKIPTTVEGFEKAFKHLSEENKLLFPNAATLAKLTSQQVKELCMLNGNGEDWDPRWKNLPPQTNAGRLTKQMMKHPEDFGRVPTKREFAEWNADRIAEWCDANGHKGHELPEMR
jgi:hypothetical protein